jgi:hypothetical protein
MSTMTDAALKKFIASMPEQREKAMRFIKDTRHPEPRPTPPPIPQLTEWQRACLLRAQVIQDRQTAKDIAEAAMIEQNTKPEEPHDPNRSLFAGRDTTPSPVKVVAKLHKRRTSFDSIQLQYQR